MMTKPHILSSFRSSAWRGLWTGTACMALMLLFSPVRALAAGCEADGAAGAEEIALAGKQDGDIAAMVKTIEDGWETDLDVLRSSLGLMDRDLIIDKLNWFWRRTDTTSTGWLGHAGWGPAWKAMTGQLSEATLNETRQLGSINDATNLLKTDMMMQKERIKAKLAYQPTDQACRFDTTATYMTPSRETSDALAQGFEWDFTKAGNNEQGSLAQYGPANLEASLWKNYTKEFCDFTAENGHAGCDQSLMPPNYTTAYPNVNANFDAEPGYMLFAQYTINMSNPVALDAMNQMMFNVLGYEVPDPIIPGSLGSPTGMAQLLNRRQYITQMDTVGSLLYAVVAERAPGPYAPEVQDFRSYMGVIPYIPLGGWPFIILPPEWTAKSFTLGEASPTPSPREIRQSIVEQLWDPSYYKALGDNPATIAQKDLYLKAYSLVMLYDMVSKQEKISNVYAVETANLLSQMQGSVLGPIAHSQGFK